MHLAVSAGAAVRTVRRRPDHLRYLWPGLAAFTVVLGLALGALYDRSRRRDLRLAALAVGLSCALGGSVEGSRQLLVGDLDMITWEWRELVGVQPPLRDMPLPDAGAQERMAERLRAVPAGERGSHGAEVVIERVDVHQQGRCRELGELSGGGHAAFRVERQA